MRAAYAQAPPRRPVVPSAMLGMMVFILTEAMLFAGFISAFTISRAGAPGNMWPPPGQPPLPAAATAASTAALLLSGALLLVAYRRFHAQAPAGGAYGAALGLGAGFVALQAREWWALLGQGASMSSSTAYAFFFLIVGAHALHVTAGVAAMAVGFARLRAGRLSRDYFLATLVFWTFVVAGWPVIYARVYF